VYKGYAPAVATAPYFFLSYAHGSHGDLQKQQNDLDSWVGELFRDLCQHVKRLAGLPRGAIPGFMEGERQQGSKPVGVADALATCRVFVPLYSSSYFADERCGKEWAYFVSRGRNRGPRASGYDAAIVPGVWDPVDPDRLPLVARSLAPSYGSSDACKDLGLYGIMKLSRFRKEYDKAVQDLAHRIVTAAKRFPVAEGPAVDFGALDSAFGIAGRAQLGDKWLRITIVAPREDELPDGRRSSPLYGPSALDWSPYLTDTDYAPPIAACAVEVAKDLGFRAEVGDLDQHEAALLAGSPSPGPQILIIDPWALLVPPSQHLLQRLDARQTPWVQAVIPWGSGDDGSQQAAGKLRVALDAAFKNKLAEVASTSGPAARGVPNLEEFQKVLRQLIWAASKKYLSKADAFPPAGEVVERPRVIGSGPPPG
jgi:FxsC-like protein